VISTLGSPSTNFFGFLWLFQPLPLFHSNDMQFGLVRFFFSSAHHLYPSFMLHVHHTRTLGTLAGGVGYLAPIDESVFRRLGMLQSALLAALPHAAGLNPQAYRALQKDRLLRNRKVCLSWLGW